jgi:hypothetical protein
LLSFGAKQTHVFCVCGFGTKQTQKSPVLVLQVKAGQAAPAELQREQEKLGLMDSQLQGLQSNYTKMRDQAAALLQRMSSSSSAADAAGTGGSAKSDPVASGFSNAMYAGLKFSGLAMRVAADVVSSVTDDAGKMLRVSVCTFHDVLWAGRVATTACSGVKACRTACFTAGGCAAQLSTQ